MYVSLLAPARRVHRDPGETVVQPVPAALMGR